MKLVATQHRSGAKESQATLCSFSLSQKCLLLHNIIEKIKEEHFMRCCDARKTDYGPEPYVLNVERRAVENQNFREAVWTGEYLQMTLMSIPVCGEIGLEKHCDTDQLIRVEQGNAMVQMGKCKECLDIQKSLNSGEAVFVPAGTWHNVSNTGRKPLKVSSVYAPPNHPRGTLQRNAEE
jgi:mannose-6-phosphate isomerase-like protein (cupin superfamily)